MLDCHTEASLSPSCLLLSGPERSPKPFTTFCAIYPWATTAPPSYAHSQLKTHPSTSAWTGEGQWTHSSATKLLHLGNLGGLSVGLHTLEGVGGQKEAFCATTHSSRRCWSPTCCFRVKGQHVRRPVPKARQELQQGLRGEEWCQQLLLTSPSRRGAGFKQAEAKDLWKLRRAIH